MIVIVYGYDGSGAGHWQRWLEDELRARALRVAFPELPAPTAPQRDRWVETLAELVAAARADADPVTFVCHSLGCWAVDHLLAEHGAEGVHGALLAAPPSPLLPFEPVESFLPPPCRPDAWRAIAGRSLLVGSDDDLYASAEELEEIARTIGIPHRILPGVGHINVETGFGPWPFVLDWLESVGATKP